MPHAGGCGKPASCLSLPILATEPHKSWSQPRFIKCQTKALFSLHSIVSPLWKTSVSQHSCSSRSLYYLISVWAAARENYMLLHTLGGLKGRHRNSHLLQITKIYYKQTQMVRKTKGGLVQQDGEHKVEPICTHFLSHTFWEWIQERMEEKDFSFCLFVLQ